MKAVSRRWGQGQGAPQWRRCWVLHSSRGRRCLQCAAPWQRAVPLPRRAATGGVTGLHPARLPQRLPLYSLPMEGAQDETRRVPGGEAHRGGATARCRGAAQLQAAPPSELLKTHHILPQGKPVARALLSHRCRGCECADVGVCILAQGSRSIACVHVHCSSSFASLLCTRNLALRATLLQASLLPRYSVPSLR